jgi:hypothetical protein
MPEYTGSGSFLGFLGSSGSSEFLGWFRRGYSEEPEEPEELSIVHTISLTISTSLAFASGNASGIVQPDAAA